MTYPTKTSNVKLVFSGHSKRRPEIGFQDRLSLNAGRKYCRMLQESILQYFLPLLSYHLSLRPLFCVFLSDRLRRVLLYTHALLFKLFKLVHTLEFCNEDDRLV